MKEGKFNKIFEKGQKKRKVNYNLIKKMNLEKQRQRKKSTNVPNKKEGRKQKRTEKKKQNEVNHIDKSKEMPCI